MPGTYVIPVDSEEAIAMIQKKGTKKSKGKEKAKCRALFDYIGKDERYLTFKKGDDLVIIEKKKSWWTGYHVDNPSIQGFIPPNYVQLSNTEETELVLKSSISQTADLVATLEGIHDFNGTKSHHLSFKKGDRLVVFDKDGEKNKDWLRGHIEGNPKTIGKFPANHTKEIKSNKSSEKKKDKKLRIIVEAKHAHTGKDENYLSFNKGDRIIVSKKTDNWWMGKLEHDKSKKGWFPANHVEQVAD